AQEPGSFLGHAANVFDLAALPLRRPFSLPQRIGLGNLAVSICEGRSCPSTVEAAGGAGCALGFCRMRSCNDAPIPPPALAALSEPRPPVAGAGAGPGRTHRGN